MAGAMVLLACNAILGNEEGVSIERDDNATEGTETAHSPTMPGASTPPSSPSASSWVEPPDAGTADATSDAGCPLGSKACGGRCVAKAAPAFGCGAPACTPCALPHAVAGCAANACTVARCLPGWADCNGIAADGCEANLAAAATCGACGASCKAPKNAASTCAAGQCIATCRAGFADCDEEFDNGCEADLGSDKKNCGACGARCPFGRCVLGRCTFER